MVINGTRRADKFSGGTGADSINGAGGNDTLSGLGGNDTLNGGSGADLLVGGLGDDTYILDNVGDRIQELSSQGIDSVRSSVSFALPAAVENLALTGTGNLSATGNELANLLTGNAGNNLLSGGAGADTLNGGQGADTLVGGAGPDLLSGGSGADLFRILAPGGIPDAGVGAARDTIADFAGEDRIDATALFGGQNYTFLGSAAFTAGGGGAARLAVQNGVSVLQFDFATAGHGADGIADAEIALLGSTMPTLANLVGAVAPAVVTPPVVTPPVVTPPVVTPTNGIHVGVNDDLQAMVTAAGAGATFIIDAGVHRLQSVTPLHGDTFIGEAGAVLNGSKLLSGFTHVGSTWMVGGQTQQGEVRAADEPADGATMPGRPDVVFIDNVAQTQVSSLAAVGPGKFYFDYGADRIYLGTDPTGHTVEAAVSAYAFAGGASDVTIQGLTVEKYASPIQFGAIGYKTPSVDWLVANNEVRLNFGVGIIVGDNSHITGNFVHDNGEMGIGGNGDNILVDNNEIAHNGYFSQIDPYWEGGGSKFAETNNLVVRGNNSHDNNGYGLWTDIDNINTLYENNTVTNNLGAGISHEISYAAIIRNNVLTGNGAGAPTWLWGSGIQIQNSSNVQVYGNTVDVTGAGNGIALIQQDRGTGAYGPYVTTGNQVHDNLIITHNPNASTGMVADYNEGGLLAGGNTFDHNTYQGWDPSNDVWAWGEFYTWAQYRSISGQEAHSSVIPL